MLNKSTKKIPDRLIQFWHNKETIPEPYMEAIQNNKIYTMDIENLFVDDVFMIEFLKNDAYLSEIYQRLNVESIRSDIARLVLLYEFGGFYMDMSIRLKTSLDLIVDQKSDIALLKRDDQPRYAKYPEQAHIGAMFMAAAPKSPFIACCLAQLIDTIVSGHYNHHILFAATKYTDDTYIRYLDSEETKLNIQLLSFKQLKQHNLTHLRIPGLQNSWKVHEVDGIFNPEDLLYLQKNYSKRPCYLG
jgi:hypothetical protein